MVVKQLIEPDLDPVFLPDSYGYRPRKSALDAVASRVSGAGNMTGFWSSTSRGLFDNIDHELLAQGRPEACEVQMGVALHRKMADSAHGDRTELRSSEHRGTPQGGVISPILSNLFLHYAFDLWMRRTHPDLPWCRYADDGLVHCRTEQEAESPQGRASSPLGRMPAGTASHQNQDRLLQGRQAARGMYPNVKFDFLGYCFRPASCLASVRTRSVLRLHTRGQPHGAESHARDDPGLEHPAKYAGVAGRHRRKLNPLLRGWIAYYGRYTPSALIPCSGTSI